MLQFDPLELIFYCNDKNGIFMSIYSNLASFGKSAAAGMPKYPFARMFTPSAIKKAMPFLDHEYHVLQEIINQSPAIKNIVVVGSGPLAYSEFAKSSLSYLGIDPYFQVDSSCLSQNINTINCLFEDLSRHQLREGNTIFVFWFNVLFYISNPVDTLNKLLKEGDLVFHSTWCSGSKGELTMSRYFKEIYRGTSKNYRSATRDIKNFPKKIGEKIASAKRIETFSNGINSVEVIHTRPLNQSQQ